MAARVLGFGVAVAVGLAAGLGLGIATKRRRRVPCPKKRVVFLDIDGVLNRTKHADQVTLEKDLVDKLKTILSREGHDDVQIVLSTFWRPFDDYIGYALYRVSGIDGSLVIGATPGMSKGTPVQTSPVGHLLHAEAFDHTDHYPTRAAEIRQWLRHHPTVTHYAILDDRKDAADGELLASFVRTEPSEGLTDEHVKKAIQILSA